MLKLRHCVTLGYRNLNNLGVKSFEGETIWGSNDWGQKIWGSNAMYQESLADVVVAKLEVLVELSSSRVPGLVL